MQMTSFRGVPTGADAEIARLREERDEARQSRDFSRGMLEQHAQYEKDLVAHARDAELKADELEAEVARWRGLTEVVREITGEPEGWPSHGNALLAIGAKIQLMQMEIARLRKAEQELAAIRDMLLAGQGSDDGGQILPDFEEGTSVPAMVAACIHLLERRRDALDGFSDCALAEGVRV